MLTPEQYMNQFVNQYVGEPYAGAYQCVAWAEYVMQNFLGLSHVGGNAGDIFNNASDNEYFKILNSPTGVPQEGDIIIWAEDATLPYGHIAVCSYTADENSFISYDQNWPLGSKVHRQTHSYAEGGYNVHGWLRPKNRPWLTPAPAAPIVQPIAPVAVPVPVVTPPVETPVETTPTTTPVVNVTPVAPVNPVIVNKPAIVPKKVSFLRNLWNWLLKEWNK